MFPARLATLCVAAALCLSSRVALAQDSGAEVRNAYSQAKTWLNSSNSLKAWSDYLDLAGLEAQLAPGATPNLGVLERVLDRLKSSAPGLELAPFARLRDSLATWVAELKLAGAADLSQAALDAEAGFQPISDAAVSADRAELDRRLARLEQYLGRSGKYGAGWRSYLRLNDLAAQLRGASPSADELKTIEKQFRADQPGLELPVIADVATALDRYSNDMAARQGDLKEQFSTQLKGLSDELKQFSSSYNNETADSLGERLDWLSEARQAPALVRVIRQRYSRPNLHAHVSSRVAGAGFDQVVDEITPVRDNILGTDIRGTGRTVGRVQMRLLPDANRALLETILTGTVNTRNVGYNGPAVIHTMGTTTINGSKRIVADANGLASYPATATANTSTRITGISAGGNIAQKVATRRVYESKSEAERIGSEHAAARVRRRVDAQANEQLSRAHWNYLNKVRNPLIRRGEFPQMVHVSTTPQALQIDSLAANRRQIAAPSDPPAIQAEQDIGVQVHESFVNNLAAGLLSGVTMREEDMQKQAKDLLGKVPEQLQSEADRDPWSITFAKVRPVTVRVTDGGIEITVRGQRYTSGDRDFQAMNVTANYKVGREGERYKLVRDEQLLIEPPNARGRTLSGRQIALRTLLERRFGKLFEREIKSEGLVLPGKWRAAGRLDLKQLQLGNGWLVAALVESGVPAPPEPPNSPEEPAAKKVAQASR